MADHKKKGKDAIKREIEINRIRAKFGKSELGSQKTYKQRLKEYNKKLNK